jgi:predicted phage terminase large subunit-like protein
MEQSWTLPPSLALWKAQKRAAQKTAQAQGRRTEAHADFSAWLPIVTPSFTWNWKYLRYIQAHLDKITSGEINRLMLFVPPRHGKSEMVTVRYPVWRLEQNPSERIIIGAYNQILANKFSRKARRIAETRIALAPDRQAVEDWETPSGGGLRAIGVGAGITGQGGHIVIIDDPVKSREEAESDAYRERVWDWYRDDLYTRLEPGGQIILIQTRWHEDDLAGRILNSDNAKDWTVVSLPALAEENDPLWREVGEALCPARYDEKALADIQSVLKSSFYALYQQRPQPPSGNTFKTGWFARRNPIERQNATLVIQAWDTAFKEGQENDRSACITLAAHSTGIYVLDAWRDTVAYPDLIRRMQQKAMQWAPDAILVEDKGSGTSAVQTLRGQTNLPIIAEPTHGRTKVERANQVTAFCEAGRVVFPQTPWADDLLDELIRFPTGAHDDQVDAFVYALHRIAEGMYAASSLEY